ncbi:MAG TPA: hypothetical protein VM557_11055 [Thermoanaerobaculia bacterium]|nr:hypothetical protein [Thermoanaerobaculia bacterium]
MKNSKGQERLAVRTPVRAVSLHIRDYQVTVKVRGPVPTTKPQAMR